MILIILLRVKILFIKHSEGINLDETKEILNINRKVDLSQTSYRGEEFDIENPDFIIFMKEIFEAFSMIESQNMTLIDVYLKHSSNRTEILQSFFISCHFWGCMDMTDYRNYSPIDQQKNLELIKKKLNHIRFNEKIKQIASQNKKSSVLLKRKVTMSYDYFCQIVQDLLNIQDKIQKIENNLSNSQVPQKEEGLLIKFNQSEDQLNKPFKELLQYDRNCCGKIFPLKCGHNGSLSQREYDQVAIELKQVGFITKLY